MKPIVPHTLLTAILCTASLGQTAPPGSSDVESCRQNLALRGADNIFDPALGDVLADDHFRAYTLGDLNADGTPDLFVVDYFMSPHYAAVACGASGDILYGLESVGAADYRFAVEATGIGDADLDGVPDFMLMSYDGFLMSPDVLILSGIDGRGIARIEVDSGISPSEYFLTPTLFTDVDKSGTSNSQDVYIIIDAATGTQIEPGADLNLDGVVDDADIALATHQSGTISPSTVATLAAALGGTSQGSGITLGDANPGPNPGIFGWIRKLYDCASCLINCIDTYDDAWECRGRKRQAECDCYNLPIEDRGLCLQDVHENFMRDCIAQVADAAGDCAPCILECHPLAP